MKFTIKDLIAGIINSNLSNEDKINLLESIMETGKLNDGLYLKKDEEGLLECWFRNVDENGSVDCGPTCYDIEAIINDYAFHLEPHNYNF